MGLSCQINLHQPQDGAFYPGEVVSGVIRYKVDEPTQFSKITISLKGRGYIKMKEVPKRDIEFQDQRYSSSEICIDEDHIYQDEKIDTIEGAHELPFSFNIPTNIPPTYEFWRNIEEFSVRCRIKYYVRIKFEKSDLFSFTKHFRKEIVVASAVIPKLPVEPTIYDMQRKLIQLFQKKPSIVNIKATIMNPVVPKGGKIEIIPEIFNDTNVKIKSVKTQLVEVTKFKTIGKHLKDTIIVPGTETGTLSIDKGETETTPIELRVPNSLESIENSELVSRYYYVKLTVKLPLPYRNISMDIPIQIGNVVQDRRESNDPDPPPSYWETMGEEKKHDDFDE